MWQKVLQGGSGNSYCETKTAWNSLSQGASVQFTIPEDGDYELWASCVYEKNGSPYVVNGKTLINVFVGSGTKSDLTETDYLIHKKITGIKAGDRVDVVKTATGSSSYIAFITATLRKIN